LATQKGVLNYQTIVKAEDSTLIASALKVLSAFVRVSFSFGNKNTQSLL